MSALGRRHVHECRDDEGRCGVAVEGQRGKRDRARGGAVADVGGGTGSNGGERGGHDVEVLDPRRRDLDAECLAPPPQLAAR